MEIGVVLIIWIILCFVAGSIAENKGNSALAAFLISLVLSPLIGIVIALAEKPNEAVLVVCGVKFFYFYVRIYK